MSKSQKIEKVYKKFGYRKWLLLTKRSMGDPATEGDFDFISIDLKRRIDWRIDCGDLLLKVNSTAHKLISERISQRESRPQICRA